MNILNEEKRTKKAVKRPQSKTLLYISLINLILLIVVLWFSVKQNTESNRVVASNDDIVKKVALKLAGNGVELESARWLEKYLEKNSLDDVEKVKIAFKLANIFFNRSNYEKALAWLYFGEHLNKDDQLKADLSKKIIATLENLKKFADARYALTKRTQLGNKAQDSNNSGSTDKGISSGDAVVAQIGNQKITKNEINRAISKLPDQIAKNFSTEQGRENFLRQYVAETVLFRKAVRQGMDDRPEFREKIKDLKRGLLLQEMIQKKMADFKPTPMDLKNFYEANKQSFGNKPFKEVQKEVSEKYSGQKLSEIYQALIIEAAQTEKVEFFPENVQVQSK